MTIEDSVKDGQTQVLGRFKTEGQNPPENGLPGEVTPAELYTVCFQRLWDAGLMNGFVTLVCADLLFRNDQVRQRRAAAQAPPSLPEGLPQLAKPTTEDAVVIPPDAPEAPPAATVEALAEAAAKLPDAAEPVVPLPEGVPTHLPDGTPVRVAAGSGDAKGLAW